MIRIPTTPTGEVRKVGNMATGEHPHHTDLWGVGVWWWWQILENAGEEDQAAGGCLVLQIQAGCRHVSGGGS
jgi:hypothetical protein